MTTLYVVLNEVGRKQSTTNHAFETHEGAMRYCEFKARCFIDDLKIEDRELAAAMLFIDSRHVAVLHDSEVAWSVHRVTLHWI